MTVRVRRLRYPTPLLVGDEESPTGQARAGRPTLDPARAARFSSHPLAPTTAATIA
jgi:hypothetical protein